MSYEFGFTRDYNQVEPIYEVSSNEWNSRLTPQQYINLEQNRFKLYSDHGFDPILFYLKDGDTYIASGLVVSLKGWYKEQSHLIGADEINFLLLAYVFTRKEYRKQGLADNLIRKIFNHVESEKLTQYKSTRPSLSDDEVFKNVSKKNIWYLYSGVGEFYSRFGGKPKRFDFFKIPFDLVNEDKKKEIESLISEPNPAKSIRLLKMDSKDDQDLIKHILQNKELQTISDITFNSHNIDVNSVDPQIPKFVIKHDYNFLKIMNQCELEFYEKSTNSTQHLNIMGAIITNTLQNKSYYCLWSTLMYSVTFIIGMGEIQVEPTSIRKTSFTNLSEIQGYNLTDFDLILKTAAYFALKRDDHQNALYVTRYDLPSEIPEDLIKDYLINVIGEDKIELVTGEDIKVLPYVRMFGKDTNDFELDWNNVGMYSWN